MKICSAIREATMTPSQKTVSMNFESSPELRMKAVGSSQKEFEDIANVLVCLRAVKILQYGESRLELHNDEHRDLAMAFSDIHRKYIRLEKQVWSPDGDSELPIVETLSDLAVYTIQAIQILGRITNARAHNRG